MHRKKSECTENSALETHLNPAQVAQKFKNFESSIWKQNTQNDHTSDRNCVEFTLNGFSALKNNT